MENLNVIFPSKQKPKKQASLLYELQVILNDFNVDIKSLEALVMVVALFSFCLFYLPL